MCLYVETKKKHLKDAIQSHKRIAKTDIIVYKRLLGPNKWTNQCGSGISFRSPYQNFSYQVGFQYYNEGPLNKRFGFNMIANGRFTIDRGLHAYTDINTARYRKVYNEKIVKCIVPAGSTYYVGSNIDKSSNNEICSDNLIITDTVV